MNLFEKLFHELKSYDLVEKYDFINGFYENVLDVER